MESSECNITDILTCSICLEIFKSPKYLPCLHTFCENCIQTYITSGFQKGTTSSIECPVCRGNVHSPKDDCKPEEWAKLLPLNFLISGLIEKQKLTRPEKMCMLCERLTVKKQESKASFICVQCADTLCETCKNYHNSMKFPTEHEIRSLDDFSAENVSVSIFKNNCTEHPSKILELYCMDHETPCCCMCVSINHRKCDKVMSLEEAAKGVRSSAKVQQLQKELRDVAHDVKTILTFQTNSLQKLEQQYDLEVKKMEETFVYLRRNLNTQESQRKEELLKIFNEKKDTIETSITLFENIRKGVENEQNILQISMSKASEVQVMLEISKLTKQSDAQKQTVIQESKSIQETELYLENTDHNALGKQFDDICTVKCRSRYCKLDCVLRKQDHMIHKFNRFSSLGDITGSWTVQTIADAISFTVSEMISLHGFLSYGCKKSTDSCLVVATVKQGVKTISKMKVSLDKIQFEDNLTQIILQSPVDIHPHTNYDVIFVMTGTGLCNYGTGGIDTKTCEGVVFKFIESSESKNGTDVSIGQIPGFLFSK